MLSCVDVMVMLSAYVVSIIDASGVGMSDVYNLNNVGDRTLPYGTPGLNWRYVDVLFLNLVYVWRPLI